jgi:hypothetical protein
MGPKNGRWSKQKRSRKKGSNRRTCNGMPSLSLRSACSVFVLLFTSSASRGDVRAGSARNARTLTMQSVGR